MRYLYKFNENKKTYYEVIEVDEESDFWDELSYVDFTLSELKTIKDRISKNYVYDESTCKISPAATKIRRRTIKQNGYGGYSTIPPSDSDYQGSQDIWIFKCEDDWFYVEFGVHELEKRGRVNYSPEVVYKCDQFDGLLELLVDREVLKAEVPEGFIRAKIVRNSDGSLSFINESNEDRFYYKIDEEEVFGYEVVTHRDDPKGFSSFEINQIYSKLNSNFKMSAKTVGNHKSYSDSTITIDDEKSKLGAYCFIYKCVDGWFLVVINGSICYKCDQMEGLLNCLQDHAMIDNKINESNDYKSFHSISREDYYRPQTDGFDKRIKLTKKVVNDIIHEFELRGIYLPLASDYLAANKAPAKIARYKLAFGSSWDTRFNENLPIVIYGRSDKNLRVIHITPIFDDYFLVLFEHDVYQEYYKCDQISGIMDLLEKINIL